MICGILTAKNKKENIVKNRNEIVMIPVVAAIIMFLCVYNVLEIQNQSDALYSMGILIGILCMGTITLKRNIEGIFQSRGYAKNILFIIIATVMLFVLILMFNQQYLQYHPEKMIIIAVGVLLCALALSFVFDVFCKKNSSFSCARELMIVSVVTATVLFFRMINVLRIDDVFGDLFSMIILIVVISAVVIFVQNNIDHNYERNILHYQNLDIVKYLFSILIIILHLRPFLNYSDVLDMMFNNIITRTCVPMYFLITGYFAAKKERNDSDYIKKYIRKIIPLYLFWSLLYFPLMLQYFSQISTYLSSLTVPVPMFLKVMMIPGIVIIGLLYTGIYYHLWYFPAVILSLWLLDKWKQRFALKYLLGIASVLLVLGATETYFGVLPGVLQKALTYYFNVFLTTRNFLFFGLFYVVLGYVMGKKKNLYSRYCFAKTLLALFALIFEAILLRDGHRLDSNIMLACVPLTYYLFISVIYLSHHITFRFPFADLSKYYYLVHPMVIFAVQWLCRELVFNIITVLIITHVVSCFVISMKRMQLVLW